MNPLTPALRTLDPRTPVIVGVGQASERIGEPGYRAGSPVDLAADAAREALADTGADRAALAAAVQVVAGVRQFEVSTPVAVAALGRSDNFPRSVALRLGARPTRAVLDVTGGQSPQHLVNELAARMAVGDVELALVCGAEAISTARHLAGTAGAPDFTEHVGGQLDDRGFGLEGLVSAYTLRHGLAGAPANYALFDNARRARLDATREAYGREIGELFAPFTRVAAANPHAAAPVERTAAELVTETAANRRIADPYLRYLVARDQVNQGAALLLASVAAARRLGVASERWVFLRGHADLRERDLLQRHDLSAAPASVLAARHALAVAGTGVDEVACFDFYSCFPVAVTATAVDGLGLDPADPRGLTVTGGLPFFGGPGNDYSMHAIAEVVQRVRAAPGSTGFVGANGGWLSKYSAGVYGTSPAGWRPDRSRELQTELDAVPAPGQVVEASGRATIETWTVLHHRDGQRTGIVVGRLDAGGARFLAKGRPGDDELLGLLAEDQPVGRAVQVTATAEGNRVSVP